MKLTLTNAPQLHVDWYAIGTDRQYGVTVVEVPTVADAAQVASKARLVFATDTTVSESCGRLIVFVNAPVGVSASAEAVG